MNRPCHQIIAIEYQQQTIRGKKPKTVWLPHSVVTTDGTFDFDWCEAPGELAYHESGGAPREHYVLHRYVNAPEVCAKLWLHPEHLRLTDDKGNALDTAQAAERGYQIIARPLRIGNTTNPFESHYAVEAECEQTVWCVVCDSYYRYESHCDHLARDENGEWIGCGASELDFEATRVSLFRLFRILPRKTIEEILRATQAADFRVQYMDSMLGGNFSMTIQPTYTRLRLEGLGKEINYEERYEAGVQWLLSLDTEAKAALALTTGWCWQYQRESWNNRCVIGNKTFIRHLPNAELAEWLALKPQSPRELHDKALTISIPFKAGCANDVEFLKDPKRTEEVTLWPEQGTEPWRSITLSVAEVKVREKEVTLRFGRVLELDGKHISELPDYYLA